MKKRSLGFGLEQLGLLVLKWPRLTSALLVLFISIAGSQFDEVALDGNVQSILDTSSTAYQTYSQHRSRFHDYAEDVVLLVRLPSIASVEAIEKLRNFHLDLMLEDQVRTVFSLFSFVDLPIPPQSGGIMFPKRFSSDNEVDNALAGLLARYPPASSLVSLETNSILFLVQLQDQALVSEIALKSSLSELNRFANLELGGTGEVVLTGRPVLRSEIARSILETLAILISVGIGLGFMVSAFVFGSVRTAVVCAMPATISVILTVGLFGLLGIPITYLTVIVPVLSLIICFADTIVLLYKWLSDENGNPDLATFSQAVRKVGPASSLTSITTAVAFFSFAFSGNPRIEEMAFFGVAGVVMAFITLMTVLPVTVFWLLVYQKPFRPVRSARLSRSTGLISTYAPASPGHVMITTTVTLAVLIWGHIQLQPAYSVRDYVPSNSGVLASELEVDSHFGGGSRLYVVMEMEEGTNPHEMTNRQRLVQLDDVVSSMFGSDNTQSLGGIFRDLDSDEISMLEKEWSNVPDEIGQRFVGRDAKAAQVSVAMSSLQSTATTTQEIAALKSRLSKLPFADTLSITGFGVVLADNFPQLLDQMRTSLFICIVLVFVVLWFVTGNIRLAIACLIPNLISVLLVENVIWYLGLDLNLTNLIGLTIAFGIAVDNAVHVINTLLEMKEGQGSAHEIVIQATGGIAPALVAGTLIMCISASGIALSAIPAIAQLGLLLTFSLLIALVSNLVILPACLLFFGAVRA